MRTKPIILIGGGGHCKSVIEGAESSRREIMGILDLPPFVGTKCLGYQVIGTDNDIPKYVNECEFIVTLGFIKNPCLRNKLHSLVYQYGGHLATVIASSAYVSRHAEIGEGTVVLHGATVNAGVKIGKGCIINTHSNIEHDATIGNYCHISTGVMINGDCTIDENTFVGSGSVVSNGVKVCSNVVIGSGSTVISDILTSGTYVGSPAKRI